VPQGFKDSNQPRRAHSRECTAVSAAPRGVIVSCEAARVSASDSAAEAEVGGERGIRRCEVRCCCPVWSGHALPALRRVWGALVWENGAFAVRPPARPPVARPSPVARKIPSVRRLPSHRAGPPATAEEAAAHPPSSAAGRHGAWGGQPRAQPRPAAAAPGRGARSRPRSAYASRGGQRGRATAGSRHGRSVMGGGRERWWRGPSRWAQPRAWPRPAAPC
jgi:hypothetical protein